MHIEGNPSTISRRVCAIAVTKTDADNVEVLEGEVLAHSPHRHEIMELLGRGLARDVAVEWCGEPDNSRVVAI